MHVTSWAFSATGMWKGAWGWAMGRRDTRVPTFRGGGGARGTPYHPGRHSDKIVTSWARHQPFSAVLQAGTAAYDSPAAPSCAFRPWPAPPGRQCPARARLPLQLYNPPGSSCASVSPTDNGQYQCCVDKVAAGDQDDWCQQTYPEVGRFLPSPLVP